MHGMVRKTTLYNRGFHMAANEPRVKLATGDFGSFYEYLLPTLSSTLKWR